MNRFSRVRHHINMEDVKYKHQEKSAAKKIEEEHNKRLEEVFEKQRHTWRNGIFEGMTTSGVTAKTEVAQEDPIASYDATLDASFQGRGDHFFVGDTTGENAFNGTRIRASGSGTGNSGGFNVGGSYLAFDQVGSSGGASGMRHAILKPIDATGVDTITITAIVGDDNNGGSPPNNPNEIGNEALGLMYHHGDMRFSQGFGFLPNTPGQPDGGRPEGFSVSDSLVAGDIIPVGGSKGPGLHQYSISIPKYARSKATQFSIVMQNSDGTFDNIGITDIKFERKAPMNVIIPLDDPEGLSFVRGGVDQGERNTKEKRKKKVDSILKGSRNYTKKAFGPEFPGSDGKVFETQVPEKPILDQQQANRDQTEDNISQQFTDNQIADILKKLGNPPEEVSSDPKDYDMTGLSPSAIKLGQWDPKYPVNQEGGFVARLQIAKEVLSSHMEAEFNRSLYTRDSPNYNTPEIQKAYAFKKKAEKELEGWQVFKANNNWRYLGPDIGAESVPEPVENEMTDAQREKIIAELDKDIAKFSAEEQDAYDEMKRIALEFGMDVIQVISGLFSGGTTYAVPTLGKLGLKLLRKLGKNKLGKLVRKTLRKMKSKNKTDVDDVIDDIEKGGNESGIASEPDLDLVQEPARPSPKPKPKPGDSESQYDAKGRKRFIPKVDPLRGSGMFDSYEPTKYKGYTLLERLKSKGFFNPDDIKPVFPEQPPEELDPKTRMHPKYGKRSARYKRLDPMSANSMPPTGDSETDTLVDKQRTKPKSAIVKKIFKQYQKKT